MYLVCILFFALSVPTASIAKDQHSQRVDKRQTEQRQRISEGVKTGELTRNEESRLREGQRRIQQLENRALSDGQISTSEARQINRIQDRESRRIDRQRNDQQLSAQPSTVKNGGSSPGQVNSVSPPITSTAQSPYGYYSPRYKQEENRQHWASISMPVSDQPSAPQSMALLSQTAPAPRMKLVLIW